MVFIWDKIVKYLSGRQFIGDAREQQSGTCCVLCDSQPFLVTFTFNWGLGCCAVGAKSADYNRPSRTRCCKGHCSGIGGNFRKGSLSENVMHAEMEMGREVDFSYCCVWCDFLRGWRISRCCRAEKKMSHKAREAFKDWTIKEMLFSAILGRLRIFFSFVCIFQESMETIKDERA